MLRTADRSRLPLPPFVTLNFIVADPNCGTLTVSLPGTSSMLEVLLATHLPPLNLPLVLQRCVPWLKYCTPFTLLQT